MHTVTSDSIVFPYVFIAPLHCSTTTKEPAIDFQKTLDEAMEYAELLKPMMADVAA